MAQRLRYQACAEGEFERRLWAHDSKGGFSFERTLFRSMEAVMDDYRKVSGKALELVDELTQRLIFWGLVSTSVVVSMVILKGMLG
jgi:hypothetical protein